MTRRLPSDHTALNDLMRAHQAALYRFIRRYVGNSDEAYDLLQETFVAAWQAMDRYDPTRPALAWLRRIALNKCRDWSRRRIVRRFFYAAAPIEEATGTAAPQDDDEDGRLARLDAAIAALPPQLKEPLLLTQFEGLSHQAAGDALGLSAKAIEVRVYRARKRLAELLSVAEPDGPT